MTKSWRCTSWYPAQVQAPCSLKKLNALESKRVLPCHVRLQAECPHAGAESKLLRPGPGKPPAAAPESWQGASDRQGLSAIRGSALGHYVMNRAAHVCRQAFGIVASEQLPPTSPVLTPGAMQPISRCSMATMLAALGPHCWWVVLLGCAEAGRSGHAYREGKLPAAASCLREMVFGRRLSALLEVLSDDGPSAGAITAGGTPGRNAFAARAQRLASGVPSHHERGVHRANALETARPSISACKVPISKHF